MPKVAKADKSAPAKGKATKPAKKEKDPNAPKKPLGECMCFESLASLTPLCTAHCVASLCSRRSGALFAEAGR